MSRLKAKVRIDLVRHGDCADNAFLRGQSPAVLTPLGQQQMKGVLSAINLPGLVVSSSAQRCLSFAQDYYSALPELIVSAEFQERNFGVWDGLSYEEIQRLDADNLSRYLLQPFEFAIEGAESLAEFEARIASAWQTLVADAFNQAIEHVVVITHSGVMRVLLKQVLALPLDSLFQFEIGYGARLTLECYETQAEPFIKLVELVQNPFNSVHTHCQ